MPRDEPILSTLFGVDLDFRQAQYEGSENRNTPSVPEQGDERACRKAHDTNLQSDLDQLHAELETDGEPAELSRP